MSSRTRHDTMVFDHPFRLRGLAGTHPAGAYTVETEEELIEGLSFPAWQRVSTTIMRQPTLAGATIQQFTVDPLDLARALEADGIAKTPPA